MTTPAPFDPEPTGHDCNAAHGPIHFDFAATTFLMVTEQCGIECCSVRGQETRAMAMGYPLGMPNGGPRLW
jgi:hypothetical protein